MMLEMDRSAHGGPVWCDREGHRLMPSTTTLCEARRDNDRLVTTIVLDAYREPDHRLTGR